MKKVLSLLSLVVLLVSLVSCSCAAEMYNRFSIYGSTEGLGGMFDGDTFALDVYFTDDLKAYIQQTVWKGNDATTSIKYASLKSKTITPGILYLVFADDTYYTAHYDEEYSYMLWLDLPGGSIRLKMADEFYIKADFAGE